MDVFRQLCFAGLLGSCCATALAQADTLVLTEATVRADQRARPLLATPAAVTRVGARELTGRDLALVPTAALNRVPGVTMQSGALGTHRVVIRGQGARAPFTSNRVRAYLGAIPLTDGEGGTDLEDLDLGMLRAVDVVRGPAATTYGSGLGGVILFEPALEGVPKGVSTHVDALAGALGTRRVGAGAAFGGEGASLRVGYRRTQQDGFRQNSAYRRDNLTALARLRDGARDGAREGGSSGGGAARGGDPGAAGAKTRAGRGYTDLQLLWTGVRGEIPSSLGATALAEDPTRAGGTWGSAEGFEAYDRLGFGVARLQPLGARWRLEGSAFLRNRRADEPRPFNILRENTLAAGGRALLTYAHEGGGVAVSGGGEWFRDWYEWGTFENLFADFPAGTGSVRGARLTDDAEVRTQANAFAQADVELGERLGMRRRDALALTLGLGVNQTRYRLTDFTRGATAPAGPTDAYAFGVEVSPRVAVLYRPSRAWSAYAQVARGFSPPSVAETLDPDGRVNPDIAPETGWNYEVGWRGVDRAGRWHAEAVAYLLRSRDLLVARRTAEDQFVGVNAGATRHLGLELAGAYGIGAPRAGDHRAGGFGGSLYGSYALQAHRFVDFVDGDDDFGGNALTGVPRHQGAAGVEAWGRGLEGHLGVRVRGRLPVNDANTAYAEAYAVVDARVGYRWALGPAHALTLRVGADNLLDAAYVSMVNVNAGAFGGREPRYFYPGAPRVWWVGVAWAYR